MAYQHRPSQLDDAMRYWLLGRKSRIIRASATRQDKLVAGRTKGVVPGSSEAGEKLFHSASAYRNPGVNHFSPSMDTRAFLPFFKSDPLSHGNADSVINPAHFLSRDACGNDVVDDGIDGTQQLNLETAAWFPGVAVAPAQFAIDVGEGVPAMRIGKNQPSERGARFGDDGIFKS